MSGGSPPASSRAARYWLTTFARALTADHHWQYAASCVNCLLARTRSATAGGTKMAVTFVRAVFVGGDDMLGTWHRSLDYLARMAFPW